MAREFLTVEGRNHCMATRSVSAVRCVFVAFVCASTVYPQSSVRQLINRWQRPVIRSFFRLPVPGRDAAGPLAKVKKDSLVVTRSDMIMEILGTEYTLSYSLRSYDAAGRLSEEKQYQVDFLTGTDSLAYTTQYRYDPAGITMETVMCGMIQLDSATVSDTMRTITSMYPGYERFLADNPVNSTGTSSILHTDYYDSLISVMSWHDPVSGLWDTMMTGDTRCLKANGQVVQMSEHYIIESGSGHRAEVNSAYRLSAGADGMTDTVTTLSFVTTGDIADSSFLNFFDEIWDRNIRYINHYDSQGRLVSQTLELQDTITGVWTYNSNNLQHFGVSGLVDTTWVQLWDTAAGQWENLMKTVYTYGSIQIAAIHSERYRPSSAEGFTLRRNNGMLQVISSGEPCIRKVALFDLDGRMINRFEGTSLSHRNGIYSLPLSGTAAAVRLAAVYTEQGVHTLKCAPLR